MKKTCTATATKRIAGRPGALACHTAAGARRLQSSTPHQFVSSLSGVATRSERHGGPEVELFASAHNTLQDRRGVSALSPLQGLGAAVYFHHHPRDRWEGLADRMAEAGLSFARIGEFCWDLFEPEQGKYDFKDLDTWIDLLRRRGIGCLLCTPTASPPDWMCLRYPDIVPVKSDGRSYGFNIRRHTCPTSPRYRSLCKGVVTAMAKRYANSDTIVGWQIDNEIGHPFCYCPLCHAAFRKWLAREFGNVGAFNERVGQYFLGRSSRSFDEVPLPGPGSNPCLHQVYNCFMDNQIRDCWGSQAEWLRARGVRVPITTNAMVTWYGYDHEKLFEKLDVVAGDHYPGAAKHPSNLFRDDHPGGLAFVCAYLRGIKHGAGFGFAEFRWSPVGGDLQYPDPDEWRKWIYSLLAGGADFINFFRFDTSPSGLERGAFGLIPSSGTVPRFFESAKRLIREVKPLMAELAKTQVPVSPVGLLYSHAAHLAAQEQIEWDALRGPHGNGYPMHLAMHFRAVFANHVPPDIVYPGADFGRYRVLIVPALRVVTRKLADKMVRFARGGGILLLSVPCGLLDEQAREWEVPVPAFLDRAAGACVESYGLPRQHDVRLVLASEPGSELPRISDPAMVARLQVYPGTEILAAYEGSDCYAKWPAVTCHACGKGSVYLVAGLWDEPPLTALYGALLHGWGLKPEFPLPEGVFAVKREGPNAAFWFFFNTTSAAAQLDLPFQGTDALKGTPLERLSLEPGRSVIVQTAAGLGVVGRASRPSPA